MSSEKRGRRAAAATELRCVDCGKLTTRIEAEQRVFQTGRCGHCCGFLVAADQCAAKEPRTGRLCLGDWGHPGKHHSTLDWR